MSAINSVKVKATMAKHARHKCKSAHSVRWKSVFCMALWFCHNNEKFLFLFIGNF